MNWNEMKCLVIGGAGFIGSHLVDRLISKSADVTIADNLIAGYMDNVHALATFKACDIRDYKSVEFLCQGMDVVFLTAAIARTPWCIKDPILCYETNVMGTLHVLEACRQASVKRIVMCSSNVVYAFDTPYRTSKEALERLADTYNKMYEQSVICLRNSNVYGTRQSELGESPNVFAALRKSKKEKGYLEITGDGEQSRDYTHVSDIVEGLIAGAESNFKGTLDLCTGVNTSLNTVAKYFKCPIKYIDERPGDVKHIYQSPRIAHISLGWKARVQLEEGIKDVL